MAWADRLQQAWLTRGPLACCLWPAAALFGLVSAAHRSLYRLGWLKAESLSAPVIVVGNLVTGGAGKTPTVIALVKRLRERGFTPGIVSRGYGRRGDVVLEVLPNTAVADAGDEPLLLRLRTGAPVVVARDRVAAGRELLRRHPEIDVVVSDDGLQHHRLARQVQVLVFDERGAGSGWLLPAGPLREPMPATLPARSLVLYNAATASTELPGTVARRSLRGVVLLADWWRGQDASMDALSALKGQPLLAAAGLARPGRFFAMLREAGLTITPLALPDHHDFSALPWPDGTADVVVTEKDAVKLAPDRVGRTRVWVATLDFAFDAAFDTALAALLPPSPTPGPQDHGNATA